MVITHDVTEGVFECLMWRHTVNPCTCSIIEYGSTLYVGMTQKKNGGPIKRVQNLS